ncbi:MAG: class I SAM-dependent methyltransferase [Candidatus Hermodarchaeota archaeon]
MSLDILKELDIEKMREVFLKYTRKAFEMLPLIKNPSILDIGCGSGTLTIELARLSDGKITGIDIDQAALNRFKSKVEREGLSSRIRILNQSIYNTDFSTESFNLIWDEGVLHILNTKKSLVECNRILKLNGFLVVGEVIKWINNNLEVFPKCGFNLINKFFLPEECWWREYYLPMEKKIKELRSKFKQPKELEKLKSYESEIKMVKKNPKEFDCAFYIFQKVN